MRGPFSSHGAPNPEMSHLEGLLEHPGKQDQWERDGTSPRPHRITHLPDQTRQSSTAACGGWDGGGRRGHPSFVLASVSCFFYTDWPHRSPFPWGKLHHKCLCTDALGIAKSESSNHHWGDNQRSRLAFNGNQLSLWLFAK